MEAAVTTYSRSLAFMVLSLSLALSACGGAEPTTAEEAPAGETPAGEDAPSGSITMLGFSGLQQTVLDQDVIPKFEEETGIQVEAAYATAAVNMAKVQSGSAVDFVWVNEYEADAARSQDNTICATEDEVPNISSVYPVLVGPDNCYVSAGYQMTVITYNTDVFEENGWEAPTGWKDLFDPKYSGHVATLAITNGYGLAGFLELGKIASEEPIQGILGGEDGVDPAEQAFAELKRLKPQTKTFCVDLACFEQSMLSGDGWIGYAGHGRVNGLKANGAPLAYVIPSEGTMPLGVTTFIPKTAENPDAAQAFLNFILTPEIQELLAEKNGWAPAVEGVEIPEGAGDAPSTDEINNFDRGDWEYINQHTSDWYQRFNQEVVG